MKVLKCNKCGKIVVQLDEKPCPTVCCGEEMKELKANTSEGAGEKHVPVVKQEGNIVTVMVGEVAHPMSEEHHIAWVALKTKNNIQFAELDHTGEPVAKFVIGDDDEVEAAYEYCNLHGLWKTA